jgi:hypothetical protein
MLNARKVAELIISHSRIWVDKAIESNEIDYEDDAFTYHFMLIEANLFYLHLYDREIFGLYGHSARQMIVDELLRVWPEMLATSLNVNRNEIPGYVANFKILYNDRQQEYGCFEVINKQLVGCVISLFCDNFYAELDSDLNPPHLRVSLRVDASFGMSSFVQKLLMCPI